MRKPVLLAPDNFTPPRRTPWGGRRIVTRYKAGVLPPDHPADVVGESWEVSVEPDFPARLAEGGRPLADVLADDPEGWLGGEAARGRRATALLVKLLDTDDELSVQIHPTDAYAGLGPSESGKPESWYVLEREEGAVLYIGLREGVTREEMAEVLARGGDLSALLLRVPVEPGDFFRIDAGTPHAIGRGLTLLEPQHVVPGRRGVTYRYWDWNRRYDAEGRLDPNGAPRRLHVEDALAVTDWDAPRGEAFLDRIRLRAGAPDLDGPARIDPLSGSGGGLSSDVLWVERWAGTGALEVPERDRLRGLTVVAGEVRLAGDGWALRVPRGRSAVLPAALGRARAELAGAHALLCSVA